MSNTAIAIFGFRRPNHLLRVMRALLVQLQARPCQIPVHVFLDGPRSSDDLQRVADCRALADQFSNTHGWAVSASDKNKGLYESIYSGVSSLFDEYERVVVLEDDILTSPNFLDYIIDGLNIYSLDARVASIHGYLPPINGSLPDTFFLRGADCWGWATWRDRWSDFRHDAAEMLKEIREQSLEKEFNMGGGVPNTRLLELTSLQSINSWAICWHASCFLANRYTLYPGKSLVKNIGLDSTGEHCVASSRMETEWSHGSVQVLQQPVASNDEIVRKFAKQTSPPSVFNRLVARLPKYQKPARTLLSKLYRSINPVRLNLIGRYSSYEEASLNSQGYNQAIIVDQVGRAVESVLTGESAYERDGVAFDLRPQPEIVSLLLNNIKANDRIVDIGGGIGSLYINFPEIFPSSCMYSVLESPLMVQRGRLLAQSYTLPICFYEQGEADGLNPDILILSSVLQYLPDPFQVIHQWTQLKRPRIIFIDRTPVTKTPSYWSIQDNDNYYIERTTYPLQIMNYTTLMSAFPGYSLITTWTNSFDVQKPVHIGMMLVRSL